ncbi:MAG TPA: hypothetical protein VMM78_19315 [Thermomicrobiales bacterium]|nr:hypothetical protein [Thermomicrobiales bacterium]
MPRRRSHAEQSPVSAVRGLLERNLLERAVALSETRYPGSGPLVRLAHEWVSLAPGDRRQRLAAIGPEELARLRELADIQPDLARVLDDLEDRGILPPVIEQGYIAQAATPAAANEPVSPVAASEPVIYEPEPIITPAAPPAPAAPALRMHQQMAPIPQVSRPTLDLGLPTTSEFLESEIERRAKMVEQAESILERVRARIDDSAAQFVERSALPFEERHPESDMLQRVEPRTMYSAFDEIESLMTSDEDGGAVSDGIAGRSSPGIDDYDVDLTERFRLGQVLEIDDYDVVPPGAAVAAAARELGLRVVELSTSNLSAREFWGGLVRQGRGVVPRAGDFPRALSGHNLVVVRGRLTPKAINRLRDGFCDIPGTRATVNVSDEARILLLPG